MSVISAGTTTTTAFKVTGDTTGTLQLQTGAVPTTAIDISATQVVTFPATTTLNFTGTLLLGDGSAAAPTLAHSGDTNTGIYFPGADQIAITTAGTQRVYVGATGDVGIGTSSPISKLQVAGQVRISGLSAGNTALVIPAGDILGDVSSGAFAIGNYGDASSEMRISTRGFTTFRTGATDGTNGTERMRLDSSGNLGVGATSITAGFRGLFVGDSAANHITVGVRNTNTTGISRLVLGNDAGLARFTFGYTGSTAPAPFGASLGYIGTEAAEPMLFQTNGTERARLTAGGFLGIGTSSPAAPLHVYRAGGGLTGRLGSNSGAYLSLSVDAVRDWWVGNGVSTGTDGVFGIYDATAAITRFVINSSGNVGIGTTSPAYKLHVSTTQSALKIETTTAAFSSPSINLVDGAVDTVFTASGSSSVGAIGTYSNHAFLFYTNNTERARITSEGAFLVGTTSGAYTGAGCINSGVSTVNDFCFSGVNTNSTNPRGIYLRNTNTTAGDYAIYFEASAATKFYVNGNGVIYSTNTSVQSVSDARHKENVRDLDKGLAEVLALKPRRFDWKEGKGTGAKDVAGFIAQEVETVLPELVGEWKESVDAEETFKSIGMANVIPMLVKAIQELSAKVAALESK